ncbi:MAG TPA: hypothetical protein ENK25_10565 [Bacteroidetes bacterium]|nr:hypothetical protein [Bacteroidota bacterium]
MYKINMFIILLAAMTFSLRGQESVTAPDTTQKKATEKKFVTQDKGDTIVIKVGEKNVILSEDAEDATVMNRSETETESKSSSDKKNGRVIYQAKDNGDEYTVTVGSEENPIVEYIEGDDTIYVRWGKKGIKIIETPNGSIIKIIKDYERPEKSKKKRNKFKGNWQGFEFGVNNYLTPDFRFPGDFLEVYDGKAYNLNFNLIQYSMNLSHSGKVGLVTGLGFRMNDYKLTGNNSITEDGTGYIVSLPYEQNLKMSKLHVNYFTVPLLLEFHTGNYSKGFRMGFGVIGSLKLRSYTKVKWYQNGNKYKNKSKGDFNISPLDMAATIRAGVNKFDIYANYSMVPLFKKDQGPEVYPLAVGVGFRF